MRTTQVLLIVSVILGLTSLAYPQWESTSFTWSGILLDAGVPLDGDYDLLLTLFDAPEDGNQVGVDVFKTRVTVSAGSYSDALDFGVDIFDGELRWLEIAYRPAGFTTPPRVLLAPRDQVRRTHRVILAERIGIGTSATATTWRFQVDGKNVSSDAFSALIGPTWHNGVSYNESDQRLAVFAWGGSAGISLAEHMVGGYLIENEGQNLTFKAGYNGTQGEKMRITSAGDVGIGTALPAHKLDVSGNIGCVLLYQTSDERFKTNVTELTSALDKIEKIRGVSFEWNEKAEAIGAEAGQKQIGVVAQEVENVFPEIVASSPAGYKSVDYTKLTAVLIQAVKELKAENDSLRSRLQALEISLDKD